MVIKIQQETSNLSQSYYVSGDFCCQGELGSVSRFQDIFLYKQNEEILRGKYRFGRFVDHIPFRYLFGYTNFGRAFHLYRQNNLCGSFIFSLEGFLKSSYVVSVGDNTIFHCYFRGVDSFHYISVYCENRQIALVETSLRVVDGKYSHTLYLLDEYEPYKDILTLFVLYYANYNFTNRFHMSKGTSYSKSWTFSEYNEKYDPHWRETHFPNEKF